MTGKPPLLPEETLHRVMRTARVDGWIVMIVATMAAVSMAQMGNPVGVWIGLAICGAGAVELHGVQLLGGGDSRGMRWLIGGQLLLMAGVLAYAAWRGWNFDEHQARLAAASMSELIERSGQTVDDFIANARRLNPIAAGLVAVVTVIFQGAMIRYYLHRYAAVEAALGVRDDADAEA